jgi:CDP-glucose 4,6-dehydratase
MESVVVEQLFNGIYRSKKVFVTGHTGFKGSWLCYWLQQLGAEVMGYSSDIPTSPNHFQLLQLSQQSVMADIRNAGQLSETIRQFQPDIIFHLAAQPLVRYSYRYPVETFDTNVMGTVHVFEACRQCSTVRAIVNITSDKAYENIEKDVAYTETDRMGGYDPYSASKGCAELVVNSYRRSFFHLDQYGSTHQLLLASARAGNVIGGGDWAEDRLVPDIVKSSVAGTPVRIRNPKATRPWQHVLEPLSGYLLLGRLLLEEKKEHADGWNFGPLNNETLRVEEVLQKMKAVWPELEYELEQGHEQPHEAMLLKLDITKAHERLGWQPVWGMDTAIEKTARWYKRYYDAGELMTSLDLETYIQDAKAKNSTWTQ